MAAVSPGNPTSDINPGWPSGPNATTLSVRTNYGYLRADIESIQNQLNGLPPITGGATGPAGATGQTGTGGGGDVQPLIYAGASVPDATDAVPRLLGPYSDGTLAINIGMRAA